MDAKNVQMDSILTQENVSNVIFNAKHAETRHHSVSYVQMIISWKEMNVIHVQSLNSVRNVPTIIALSVKLDINLMKLRNVLKNHTWIDTWIITINSFHHHYFHCLYHHFHSFSCVFTQKKTRKSKQKSIVLNEKEQH